MTHLGKRALVGLWLVVGFLFANRCHPQPAPDYDAGTPDAGPVVDAGLDVVVSPTDSGVADPAQDCLNAEAVLKRLRCVDNRGADLWQGPDGTPFAQACFKKWLQGVDYHAACIATITDCRQVNAAATGALCYDAGSDAGGDR